MDPLRDWKVNWMRPAMDAAAARLTGQEVTEPQKIVRPFTAPPAAGSLTATPCLRPFWVDCSRHHDLAVSLQLQSGCSMIMNCCK